MFVASANFKKWELKEMQKQNYDICNIYVTGSGVLTFDASLPKFKPTAGKAINAARLASAAQPVLFHAPNSKRSIWFFGGRKIS